MKPFYEESGITIYFGRAEEVLPTLVGIDAILTDPPYGIKACHRSDGGVGSISSGSKFYGRKSWDLEAANEKIIEEIAGRDIPAIIWGGNYFSLPPTSCLLVWDKMQREFSFADGEIAWTNLDGAVRIFSYSRGSLVSEGKIHPTQKPVPLMSWCIEMLRISPGSTVCDPYVGSGTTLVAAKLVGLRGIGIELEERTCEIAANRLRQGVLFGV